MGDVLTFTPRPKPAEPAASEPLPDLDLRAQIEEAAQVAVDTAERLIALLDRIDGDADLEDFADAEPSLAAPENHHASQVTWLRGNDQDRETEAAETVLPEVAAARDPGPTAAVIPLAATPRNGRGSMVTAAAISLFDLVAGAG